MSTGVNTSSAYGATSTRTPPTPHEKPASPPTEYPPPFATAESRPSSAAGPAPPHVLNGPASPNITNGTANATPPSPQDTVTANTTTRCLRTEHVVSAGGCAAVAEAAGLSLDQLRALNPAVNCSGRLYFGQALCVEVEAVVPSTPPSDAAREGVATAGALPPPPDALGRRRRSARSSHSGSDTTRERFLAEQQDAPPPSEDDGTTNIGSSGGGGGDGGGGGSGGGDGGGGGGGSGGGDGGDGGSNGSSDAPPPYSSDDPSSPSTTEADASPPDGRHHDSEAPPPATPDTADHGAHLAPPPDPLGEHGADTPPEDTGDTGGSGTGGDCSRFGAICAACNAEGCTQLVSGLPPPVGDEFNIVAALPNGQQLMLLSSDAPTTPRGSLCDKPDPNNLTPCTMISVGKFASSVMAPGSGGDDDLSKFTRLGQDWFEREFDNACQDGACHSTSPHDVTVWGSDADLNCNADDGSVLCGRLRGGKCGFTWRGNWVANGEADANQVREALRIAWLQTITGAYYQRKSLSEVPSYNPYMICIPYNPVDVTAPRCDPSTMTCVGWCRAYPTSEPLSFIPTIYITNYSPFLMAGSKGGWSYGVTSQITSQLACQMDPDQSRCPSVLGILQAISAVLAPAVGLIDPAAGAAVGFIGGALGLTNVLCRS